MEKEHMANITKIKAHDTREKSEKPAEKPKSTANDVVEKTTDTTPTASKAEAKAAKKAKRADKKAAKAEKKANRAAKNAGKKPFILLRPFVAFGRYIRDSWHELRLVRWPSRKSTWGLVLAVFIYTAIFVVFITLLDMLFNYLSNLMLG